MAAQWIKTKYPGIRYRVHQTRKHGVSFDKYYSVTYKYKGKAISEGLGWSSSGMTLDQAVKLFGDIRKNQKSGEGPQTLAEKRQIEENRRNAEREAIESAKRDNEFQARIERETILDHVFEKYCEIHTQKKSLNDEKSLYKKWIKPIIGEKTLHQIILFDLERIQAKMNKDGMAPRSVQYVKSVIRQIFHFAKARDLFHGDPPTLNFKLKKIDNKRNRFLSIEEANVLLDEIKSRSMDSYFICIMSLFCGLRFGEIAKLTWGCVDLNQRTLLIRDPKNGESRTTFISDEIYKLLSRLNPGKHADLVFPDEHGNVRKSMSDTFKRVVKHFGFNDGITDRRDHVVFHTLRHTCASWLVMNGTNLRTVQNILGHKDIAMTVRYSHLSDDYVKSQLNMLSLEEPKKTEAI